MHDHFLFRWVTFRLSQSYAENFKKIKAISIYPDPENPVVLLTGKNKQGKTSVVEAIWSLLLGEKYIPDVPIRNGADKASAFVDFGEYVVSRTFTRKGGSLTVKAKDGFKAPSPQEFLNSRLGHLVHNPLEFMRLKSDRQVEILQGLVNLKVDLEEFGKVSGFTVKEPPADPIALFDQAYDNLFERRKTVNAEVRRLEGVVKSMVIPANWEEIKRVSVTELFAERNQLLEQQSRNTSIRNSLPPQQTRLSSLERTIAEYDKRIEALKAELQKAETARLSAIEESYALKGEIDGIEKQIAALVEPDFTSIDARINMADETNKSAAKIEEWKKAEEDLQTNRDTSKDFTDRMDAVKEYKGKLIAAAGMPVEGLGFEAGSVTFNGLPLSQASGAEQIQVSCAVCMASHPAIGLITIDIGWSELDKESQQVMRDWAARIGANIICTKVCEEPETEGWHIVDGEVVAVNGQPPPEEAKPAQGSGNGSGLVLTDAPQSAEPKLPQFMMEEEPALNRGPTLPPMGLPKRLVYERERIEKERRRKI